MLVFEFVLKRNYGNSAVITSNKIKPRLRICPQKCSYSCHPEEAVSTSHHGGLSLLAL